MTASDLGPPPRRGTSSEVETELTSPGARGRGRGRRRTIGHLTSRAAGCGRAQLGCCRRTIWWKKKKINQEEQPPNQISTLSPGSLRKNIWHLSASSTAARPRLTVLLLPALVNAPSSGPKLFNTIRKKSISLPQLWGWTT